MFRWRRWRQTLLRLALFTYVILVMFALLNFKSRVKYEVPAMFADPVFTHSQSMLCHIDWKELGK
jgi:hypothetical protein